jgi:predicted XRE-type DNA-binding protein
MTKARLSARRGDAMTKIPSDTDDLMFKINAIVELKMKLQQTKMGQVTLARHAGVPAGDVADVLSGNVNRYPIETFNKLLRVFPPQNP